MSDLAIVGRFLAPREAARAEAKAARAAERNRPEAILQRAIRRAEAKAAELRAYIAEADTSPAERDRWAPYIETLESEHLPDLRRQLAELA